MNLQNKGILTEKEINRILNDIIENIDIIKNQIDVWKSEEKVEAIKIYKKGK